MNGNRTGLYQGISWGVTALGLAVVLTAAGCGGGPTAHSVTGKVTHKGKAVTGGSLTFAPVGGGEGTKPATGNIKEDGSYTLTTNREGDGAVAGKHRVLYSAPTPELPPGKELKPGESMPQSPYAGLVAKNEEVEVKSGSNTIDIELVKK